MSKKVLIVVDYQNDFVDGALGFTEAKELDSGIANKVKEYVESGNCVIFTMDTHKNDYLDTQEGKCLPVKHCIKGETGWELYGKTGEMYDKYKNNENVQMIEKPTFGSTTLARAITDLDTREKSLDETLSKTEKPSYIYKIELCGVVTNMCVISNAVIAKAALPETKITILSDLCSSFNIELHKQALNVMASMQMEVI